MDISNDILEQTTEWERIFWSTESPRLYKYRGDLYRDLFALQNNLVYIPSREQLNDPNESYIVFDNLYKEIDEFEKENPPENNISLKDEFADKFQNVGVYSMSKSPCIDCLWSYYANGHKGFCIEYDAKILFYPFKGEDWFFNLEVGYETKRVNPTTFEFRKYYSKRWDFMRKTTATKNSNWAHEQEVRFVLDKKSYYLQVIPNAVKGIYIGAKCDNLHKELIKSTAMSISSNVKLYQMGFRKDSFDMYFEEIAYK